MRVLISTLLLFAAQLQVLAQTELTALEKKLLQVDTVLIISHLQTGGISDKPFPKLVINNRPNRKVIEQEAVIAGSDRQKLAAILTRSFQDTEIERMSCYMPHHAVLLLKGKMTSYIDICFNCLRIETSSDIGITSDDFDKRKWAELKSFFINYGLTYKIDDEATED